MKFKAKHIGSWGGKPADSIELIIEGDSGMLDETITNFKSKVDEDLITSLRELADELEDHNEKLKKQNNHE